MRNILLVTIALSFTIASFIIGEVAQLLFTFKDTDIFFIQSRPSTFSFWVNTSIAVITKVTLLAAFSVALCVSHRLNTARKAGRLVSSDSFSFSNVASQQVQAHVYDTLRSPYESIDSLQPATTSAVRSIKHSNCLQQINHLQQQIIDAEIQLNHLRSSKVQLLHQFNSCA